MASISLLDRWPPIREKLKLLAFYGPSLVLIAFLCEDGISPFAVMTLYFIGCMMFYIGAVKQVALTTTRQTFFLCASIILIYSFSGRRYILYLFGCLGIFGYCVYHLLNLKNGKITVTLSYCRVMFGIILLSISSGPSTLTFINGALLLLLYNLSWINIATNGQPMKRQFLFMIHFLTNIGLILLSIRYEGQVILSIPFRMNGEHVINIIGFLGLLFNNTIAILYQKYYSVPYLTWRFFLLVFLSLFTLFTRRLFFAVSSVTLLHEFTAIALILDNPDLKRYPFIMVGQWIVIMTTFSLSSLLQLPIAVELLSLVSLVYIHKLIWKFSRQNTPWYTFLSLFIGMIIGSNILKLSSVFIAVVWSFHCLRSKKEKKLVPVILLICVTLEFIRWYYYGSYVNHAYNILSYFDHRLPMSVNNMFNNIIGFSAWIFWPYPIVALFQEQSEIVFALIGMLMGFGFGFEIYLALKRSEQPIDYDLPDELQIENYNIIFPTDTNDSGILLEVKAKKNQHFAINKSKLEIIGTHFWDCLKQTLDANEMKIVEKSYPLILTQKRMNIQSFNRTQTEWHGVIQLGTGKKGEKSIPIETIKSVLKRLVMHNNREIQIVVTYQSSSAPRKRGVLFRISTSPSRILNNKKEKPMAEYEPLW